MKVGYQGSYQQVAAGPGRQPYAVAIHVQQRRPEQLQLLHRAAVGAERSHETGVAVRAGPVDARPADAAGRRALRPRLELGAGRRQRDAARPRCSIRSRSASRETVSVKGYNDITPRMGAAYDVFGNGKTALKANLGKYLQSATNDENYGPTTRPGRSSRVSAAAAVGWPDGNGNYAIDCNLSNPPLQDNLATGGDRCAALGGTDLNFGNANPNSTIVNPAILEGWGVRPSDWQFGVSVQQELLPRVARRSRLQPALVPELLRHRQPARRPRQTTTSGR